LLASDLFQVQDLQVRTVELQEKIMDWICQEITNDCGTSFEEDTPGWAEEDGIWTFQGRVFILEKLREQVLQQHHDGLMSGHPR
jgi:hypothetical protein